MKRISQIIAAAGIALLLGACTGPTQASPQAAAEDAAMAYVKADAVEDCKMHAGETAEEVKECEDKWSTGSARAPYSEADYSEAPHITQTVKWNKSGYAVMIRSTKHNQARAWMAVAVVDENGTWKIEDDKTGVDEPSSDLCYILGGECE